MILDATRPDMTVYAVASALAADDVSLALVVALGDDGLVAAWATCESWEAMRDLYHTVVDGYEGPDAATPFVVTLGDERGTAVGFQVTYPDGSCGPVSPIVPVVDAGHGATAAWHHAYVVAYGPVSRACADAWRTFWTPPPLADCIAIVRVRRGAP